MKRALIHVGVFLSMVVGLIAWMTTISRSTWVRFFDKVLSVIGFDTVHFKLAAMNVVQTAEGRTQSQAAMLMVIILCVILPFFLSGILVEIYSLIATNKDTKKFRQNERAKNVDESKGIVHIVDNVLGVVFALIALIVTAVVPFSKFTSPMTVGIVVVTIYASTFVLQIICYKIIKKQIWNLRCSLKNRKAWR